MTEDVDIMAILIAIEPTCLLDKTYMKTMYKLTVWEYSTTTLIVQHTRLVFNMYSHTILYISMIVADEHEKKQ